MSVQTIGWKAHPRTHGIALAVITLVTVVTVISGIYALWKARPHETATSGFDPTSLTDVLMASSMGSLANELSQPKDKDHPDHLKVNLDMTGGHYVLNTHV